MDQIIELFKHLINPLWIIEHGGLYLLLAIIFAETGLFIGFFLPGDSLLFVAGIYSAALCHSFFGLPFVAIIVLIAIAGVLGNMVGFWFGKKSGPIMFKKKDTFFFKQKHLHQAHEFFVKYGGGAIFFARFLPIVRTFAPIVAGIVQMETRKFMMYNIIGSFAWVFSMMLAGHYLDKFFPNLKNHLELIILVLVLVTTLPVILKLVFGKVKHHHDHDHGHPEVKEKSDSTL
ncbi:membrane-associated protein [Chitinophaga niastensis]|uniref:Membrane-associated protein n=1 Tax=Chitinophaga niastensis TaxID=536980 RepID=A0A2P8HMJ4_CHINA|nr:DedA family protein [Chitinophaga niastensis]PSL47429.1 membrane-associated protein [Chitinophaga niastensis]